MVLLNGPSGSAGGTQNFECRWFILNRNRELPFMLMNAECESVISIEKCFEQENMLNSVGIS